MWRFRGPVKKLAPIAGWALYASVVPAFRQHHGYENLSPSSAPDLPFQRVVECAENVMFYQNVKCNQNGVVECNQNAKLRRALADINVAP